MSVLEPGCDIGRKTKFLGLSLGGFGFDLGLVFSGLDLGPINIPVVMMLYLLTLSL